MTHADWQGGGAETDEVPRFCPRCLARGKAGQILCDECGETMALSGYCTVCDNYLSLAPGALCPKHDLTLDDAPPPARFETMDTAFTDWVRVAAYPHPMAAEAPRIRLEAEGIPAFLEGERMGDHALYAIATGGVKLLVPKQLEAEARILLSQSWSLPIPADDEIDGDWDDHEISDDLDDTWKPLPPDPGARRRMVMKIVIVVILAYPVIKLMVAVFAGG